jgi:hypothetical protein
VTAADLVAQSRVLLATPNSATSTRWNNTDLLQIIDRAVKYVVGVLYFPNSRINLQLQQHKQLYQIDQRQPPNANGVHRIDRVYVNGQQCSPVNIGELGGDQLDIYDQSATGTPAYGADSPMGAGGGAQPQWTVATPTTAPFLNAWGAPRPTQAPFFPGQPPRFYVRGGFIGIVPMMLPSGWITIDCVMVPNTLQTVNDPVDVPDRYFDTICWKVCEYGKYSDPGQESLQAAEVAERKVVEGLKDLRTWKRQFEIENTASIPDTGRAWFSYGGNRVGGSGAGWNN